MSMNEASQCFVRIPNECLLRFTKKIEDTFFSLAKSGEVTSSFAFHDEVLGEDIDIHKEGGELGETIATATTIYNHDYRQQHPLQLIEILSDFLADVWTCLNLEEKTFIKQQGGCVRLSEFIHPMDYCVIDKILDVCLKNWLIIKTKIKIR